MAENDPARDSFDIDFRTGQPTAISGRATGESQRAACAALNRKRARGIRKADQESASREPVPIDVWTTTFRRQIADWEVPLLPLDCFGLHFDADGFLINDGPLEKLTAGAEAMPFLDRENEVVYKLFYLRESGALGKKLVLARDEQGDYRVDFRDADLLHTLDKISVLNLAGAHATEIVGLSDSGEFLIVKQPLAFDFEDFYQDQKAAVTRLRAVLPRQASFGRTVAILWCENEPWILGDLHERNIMRDANNNPCVIDALLGSITPVAAQEVPWLRHAIEDAKRFRETGMKPSYDLFNEVDDAEL